MTNQPRVTLIRQRLQHAFAPDYLEVLDESDEHIGHVGHQGGGRHFAIVIKAISLNQISRVKAHRQIYAIFQDMIPNQIHALRIKIL